MADTLETAARPETLKRIVIDPLTRVEGHGKVTLLQDEDGQIRQARLHIVEFRGFEKFVQGRPYWELPVLVQRLCGICPVSHQLAAAKATDQLAGVGQIPPTARAVRRLMHFGQTLQSHALHFFHLSAPDLLFGFDDAVRHRNIAGLIQDHPELARRGIGLRKYGQEIIRLTTGRRIHGTGAVPGGVNRSLERDEVAYLARDIGSVIDWCSEAVDLVRSIFLGHRQYHADFARVEGNLMSLTAADGALEIYDGGLRARDPAGGLIFDQVPVDHYAQYIKEGIRSWSYMKFPFIEALGPERGWYRVGPLARVNNCDYIPTPLAEQRRADFVRLGGGAPVQSTLAYHWARMIEALYCAESIRELLADPELQGVELKRHGSLQQTGIGVIEAPRGTLIHHYEIGDDSLVRRANLIVSTTHNNQAMNESIRQVAVQHLDGRTLDEALLNQVEVAIRAYDPCLSCATHAMGQMPLELSVVGPDGQLVDRILKRAGGAVCQGL